MSGLARELAVGVWGSTIGSLGANGVHKMMTETDGRAGLSDGGARVRNTSRGWHSAGGQQAFWIIAAIGALVLCAAWYLYGSAYYNEMTDACLTESSKTSTVGFLLGAVPAILAHLLVLIPLLAIGAKYHSHRVVGIFLALVVVAIASGIGIALNEFLLAGQLFTTSAAHREC